jgi:N-acetylneuraminate synthase
MKKVFLIGEIGINHNGSLKITKQIIDLAKESGFDAVKFQKRDPNISVPDYKKNEIKNTPWGNLTYLEYKKKIEFNKKEYDQIDKYCKKKKIDWFASVWDLPSLQFMSKYKPKFHKVASCMLTNYELLNQIAKKKVTTFISTGMSTIRDVERVVKIFKKNKCPFILMHSVSKYPCPMKDLNLKMIQTLKDKFKCNMGYSGHEVNVGPSVYAACLGADYIERHITIDRALWGTDHAASLGPDGIKLLRNMLDKYELSIGTGVKKFLPEEKEKLKTMKYW